MRRALLLLALAACARVPRSAGDATPDLLIVGTIHTLDPQRPNAGSILVRNGRIACVGPRDRCAARASPGRRTLELKVGCVLPGLADAHLHVLAYARSLEQVSCAGLTAEEECVARVARRARETPSTGWLVGGGWDQNLWPGGALPTEQGLSEAIPDRPVFLLHADGRAAWLNARALELAGIGKGSADPPGGRIVRLRGGRPSGVLLEEAVDLVRQKIPPLTLAERERLLADGLAALARMGLTAVQDAGADASTLEAYAQLARADRLPIRVYAMIDGMVPEPELREQLARWKGEPRTGRLVVRAVRLRADGALATWGAALLEPYLDDPSTRGLMLLPPEGLRARIELVAQAGFQPAVTAAGDRANRDVLRALAAVEAEVDLRQLRPRVEGMDLLRAEDASMLERSQVVASMQPELGMRAGGWVERRIGHGTPAQQGAYAWRQALESGALLVFGSGAPEASPDPRLGIAAAEGRIPEGAFAPWMPEQRLTREGAIVAYTGGAAFASFAEGRLGMIREGYEADLTAFGRDLLAVSEEELPTVPVRATIVGGRIEYER